MGPNTSRCIPVEFGVKFGVKHEALKHFDSNYLERGKSVPITDREIKAAKPTGKTYKITDGRGLYCEITPKGTKFFRFEYRFAGRRPRISIGQYPDVSLKEARALADELRAKVKGGIDPIVERRLLKQGLVRNNENTLEAVAWEWYVTKESKCTPSHVRTIKGRLNGYILPELGRYPIADISVPMTLAVLRKIEGKGVLETANRVRGLMSEIFDYAKAVGLTEKNPAADLRGVLMTPKKRHMAALTKPKDVGRLMLAIEGYRGQILGETALQLSPYVFLRPGELRHLEWIEVNFDLRRIELPGAKMKMGLDHIVPLSDQAVALLTRIQVVTGNGRYVFPSQRSRQRPISDNAVRTALRTIGYSNDQMTPHGFRAMARTLLDEQLKYRPDWIEHQLAHTVKDPNGRAYNRTVFLEERREMMQTYADYLDDLREKARAGG